MAAAQLSPGPGRPPERPPHHPGGRPPQRVLLSRTAAGHGTPHRAGLPNETLLPTTAPRVFPETLLFYFFFLTLGIIPLGLLSQIISLFSSFFFFYHYFWTGKDRVEEIGG